MVLRSFLMVNLLLLFTLSLWSQQQYSARTAHIYVQSSNKIVNLEADNFQVASILNVENGDINFLGLLKSFEFRIGGLDRVFNSKIVDVLHRPKFKYLGKITNIEAVNFDQPGTYPVTFKGILYIWDSERITPGKGTIEVHSNGSISAHSDLSFMIEEASVEQANELIRRNLPAGINVTTDKLGISRAIKVEVRGTYKKKRSSSNVQSSN